MFGSNKTQDSFEILELESQMTHSKLYIGEQGKLLTVGKGKRLLDIEGEAKI